MTASRAMDPLLLHALLAAVVIAAMVAVVRHRPASPPPPPTDAAAIAQAILQASAARDAVYIGALSSTTDKAMVVMQGVLHALKDSQKIGRAHV